MALDDIIQSILAEAKKEADKVKQQGVTDIEALKKEFKEKANEEEKRILDSAQKEADRATTQAQFLAISQKKAGLLTKKQEILDKVYKQALEKLAKLDPASYQKLVASLLKKLDEPQGEVVPVKGKESLTKEALNKSGKPYQLSTETISGKGGFVFKTKTMQIDNRFAVLIDHVRQDTEMEVSKILFS
ncbi:MAG: V-type ATP synthase subunit E family protein [Patescibacteria group bacterium]